ncbi:MAG: hypothetical protein J6P09_08440, partial [Methanobrevibacter sp.]|nr:hypothetical protein [Methanobrevibacter sp.]
TKIPKTSIQDKRRINKMDKTTKNKMDKQKCNNSPTKNSPKIQLKNQKSKKHHDNFRQCQISISAKPSFFKIILL